MTSTKCVHFRDIDSSVLALIQSSSRGGDISALLKWGAETGSLSKNGRVIALHLICDYCCQYTKKRLYEARKALKQGSRDAYCSKQCCSLHHATKNTKPCVVCGKPRKDRHQEYCSPECQQKIRWDKRKKRICPRCRARFAGWTVYCSSDCADADHSERMRGAQNSRFRVIGRYSNQFKEMRLIVLERDDHRCASCQAPDKIVPHGKRTRGFLQAHHIDENSRNNVPENLISLCPRCHKTHHHGKLALSPQLPVLAAQRSASMTSRLKDAATSLLKVYSSTTA